MTNIAVSCLRRVLRWAGYDLQKRATNSYPEDYEPHEIENIEAVRSYTQTSPSRMIALVRRSSTSARTTSPVTSWSAASGRAAA